MPIIASSTREAAAAVAMATALAAPPSPPAQTPAPDVAMVLSRVGDRVAEYYRRGQSIVLREKATMLEIGHDFGSMGFARVTEYELHIEPSADGDTPGGNIVRELIKINGRPPRPTDRKDRNGCTDDNPVSPEPLAFLLAANRGEYRFTFAGFGKGKDRNALLVDFASTQPEGDGKLVEDPNGHPDCFSFSIPVIMKGRLWIDAETFDVIRLEQHISGPGDIRVPVEQQRKHNLPGFIVIERHDTTIRYGKVSFKDPEETLVLPESIETVLLVRGGLQSIRKRQDFSDYRRFLTGGRIVK
ncbi:MAG TPA: hypothetical protein VEU08_11250 [Vicinamibacterales bacterium]|nr:hypothetical protein [Vicinamibacterales bacterium]